MTVVPVTIGVTVLPHAPASASTRTSAPEPASRASSDPVLNAVDPAGAPMLTDAGLRHTATTCYGDLADTSRTPVLLVPGTGLSAAENWAPTYRPALLDRGFPVCEVDLPAYATRDIQISIEYVATAIGDVSRTAGRPISVLGLSQGALLPRAALKIWPGLEPDVDDVIGLAGVYDAGSAGVDERCGTSCVAALQQLRPGSDLLTELGARTLPEGPSYTNIGTTSDLTVTPQPTANEQSGSHALTVQDVCPGRTEPQDAHSRLAGDAVAFALVLDALESPGPASAARVPTSLCAEHYYPEFDEQTWTDLGPVIGSRLTAKVTAEPALRCYLDPHCTDAEARGLVLDYSVASTRGRTVWWTGKALQAGHVRLKLGGRTQTRKVRAGQVVVVAMKVPPRPHLLTVETAPLDFRAWGVEKQHHVRRTS